MQKTTLDIKVLSSEKSNNESGQTIQITNKTNKVAFFIRPQMMEGGEEMLPCYWSSGYFTLAPSETKIVSVSYPIVKSDEKKLMLKISGWNVIEQTLSVN
jgi:hypothetical protein